MKPASTAREALIVEAIGEVAALLDRVEALGPAIDKSRQASVKASAQLTVELQAFERRMATVSGTVQEQVIRHVLLQTQEGAKRAQVIQSKAIAEAAQRVFRSEVELGMQHLARAMQAVNATKPSLWEAWLTHATTAAVASAVTWLLVAWFHAR
jgi:hypothetical protein